MSGKDPDAGKDWGQEEKGTTEDEMAGWHHWLDGHGFGQTPEVGDGQGGLACCGSWGRKESDMTERLNWTEYEFIVKEINGTKMEQKIQKETQIHDNMNLKIIISMKEKQRPFNKWCCNDWLFGEKEQKQKTNGSEFFTKVNFKWIKEKKGEHFWV